MEIYQSSGIAREHSALILNPFNGCTHDCFYCCIKTMFWTKYDQSKCIGYTKESFDELEKQFENSIFDKTIMLSFTTDVFCSVILREQILNLLDFLIFEKGQKVSILTKGNVFDFLEDFSKYAGKLKIGATLTLLNEDRKKENAFSSLERIKMLKILKKQGITTWASFEPVVLIDDTKSLMRKVVDSACCDYIKIGKMNGYFDKGYNWYEFINDCMTYLRASKYAESFYIKNDLARFYKLRFAGNERNIDYFNELM